MTDVIAPIPLPIPWRQFLEDVAPGGMTRVHSLIKPLTGNGLDQPEIEIHCPSCKAWTRALPTTGTPNLSLTLTEYLLPYTCVQCRSEAKRFYLQVCLIRERDGEPVTIGQAAKAGEWPPFRVRVPSRIRPLLGEDYEIFGKGRLAEGMGLGVAAYAYYRRVIENQKSRLFERVKAVAVRRGETEMAKKLDGAIRETQFSRAMDDVKEAVPDVLKIKGHNPLTLLHSALSAGLHNESDDECVAYCRDIRTILVTLSENLDFALKEDRELDSALSRLLTKNSGAAKT